MFGSVGEHTQVAGICTKPRQFSQPCRYASAIRLLSGRGKKTFEFASKRPNTGKNPRDTHRKPHVASQNTIVRCNMAAARHGVKNLAGVSCDGAGLLGIGPGLLVGLLTRLIIGRLLLRRLLRIPGGVPVSRKEEIQPPKRSLTSRLRCTAERLARPAAQ